MFLHNFAVRYHVHISKVALHVSCDDTCQIWIWFSAFQLKSEITRTHVLRLDAITTHTWPHFYQTRSAWSMDQGSNENHSPVKNFVPTVTKFCVLWEGQALPHDTKFGNSRDKIVNSRAFLGWSLIHGSSWSGLIKLGPVSRTRRWLWWHNSIMLKILMYVNDVMWPRHNPSNCRQLEYLFNSFFSVKQKIALTPVLRLDAITTHTCVTNEALIMMAQFDYAKCRWKFRTKYVENSDVCQWRQVTTSQPPKLPATRRSVEQLLHCKTNNY